MIAVDSSVLINFFRNKKTAAVRFLVRCEQSQTPYRIPLLCCQEVLQGAQNQKEWNLLRSYLSTQHHLHIENGWKTHEAAAQIYFDCRRRGITVRSTIDCLIAQMVLDAGDAVLHDDSDFDRIAKVRPLNTLP